MRRFILGLAVRGKLVAQDMSDEPASELLNRIMSGSGAPVADWSTPLTRRMILNDNEATNSGKSHQRLPWNKGKLIGAKPPLRASHVWSIRTKLHIEKRIRDLALFNLAIDSKLRGCDVVAVRVDDVAPNGYTLDRATVRQKKTGRPVCFELTEQTRLALDNICG